MNNSIQYAQTSNVSYTAAFILSINENTTIEKFDELCHLNPGYKLEDCYRHETRYTALSRAAESGNTALISHIINIGGKHLLNIGNNNGATALLFCIARGAHKDLRKDDYNLISNKAIFICSELLCTLGTNVNLANTMGWGDSITGDIPAGITALWLAAEKTNRLDLVIMLMKHGADTKHLQLSEKAQTMINEANHEICKEMFTENKELWMSMLTHQSYFDMLPRDVLNLIMMSNLTLDKWKPFIIKG